jgi:hypothetical protein
MRPILDAIVALHDRLDAAKIPHAFGGAFALLWCTGEPRTTVDIDLNIFVSPAEVQHVLAALPEEIVPSGEEVAQLRASGQSRVMFDGIPVDVFLDTTPFHDDLRLHLRTMTCRVGTSPSWAATTLPSSRRSSTDARTGRTSRKWCGQVGSTFPTWPGC